MRLWSICCSAAFAVQLGSGKDEIQHISTRSAQAVQISEVPSTYPTPYSPEDARIKKGQAKFQAEASAVNKGAMLAAAKVANGFRKTMVAMKDVSAEEDDVQAMKEEADALLEQMREDTEAALRAAREARGYADALGGFTTQAAGAASRRVVQEAIDQLEKDARVVADEAADKKKKNALSAAKAVAENVAPYIDAKNRALATSAEYLKRAQDLAYGAKWTTGNASKIANDAVKFQREKNYPKAQSLMILAHDLLDKGLQMKSLGLKYWQQAYDIGNNMDPFDLSAGAAANYAAYTANPVSVVGDASLPPLPFPMKMPPKT